MSKFSNYNFHDKKAIVRVDFNVPINDGNITDDTRLRAALPTINKILNDGGSVVLISHWGRPIKEMKKNPQLSKKDFSLERIVNTLSQLLNKKVDFLNDATSENTLQYVQRMPQGNIVLLENVRLHEEEEKGDESFAEKLSQLGDVYVNDAFGTAHRAHASTTTIAQFFPSDDRMFGLLMSSEVEAATKVLKHAELPFTAIIGGAKVSDKILILENLLQLATDIIIGGGMAYTFYKALGGKIGDSLCELDRLETATDILKRAEQMGVNIHLPQDSIISDAFSASANTKEAPSNDIPDGWMGLDIGTNAIEDFRSVILKSKTILWNGPMGVFEMDKFQNGTKSIALALSDATENGAFTLVGGGDSVAAVNTFGVADKVSYVSTGGGAMLEFFEGKELPANAAISKD